MAQGPRIDSAMTGVPAALGPLLSGPPRRETVTVGDATLAVEVLGTGRPVVFAHGLGGSLASWWPQLPVVAAAGYQAIAFSHRGFYPSSSVSLPDPLGYAEDLLAIVDQLGLDPIALVCQSMGGWTGVEFALRYPDRLRGLVLSATTGTFDPAQMNLPGLSAWQERAASLANAWREAGIHPACGERMAREQPALHHLYVELDAATLTLDKQALRERLFATRTRSPVDAAGIRCPVLTVSGTEDCVIPTSAVMALAGYVPNGRAVSIPTTGHSPYIERPSLFNAVLLDFLGTLA